MTNAPLPSQLIKVLRRAKRRATVGGTGRAVLQARVKLSGKPLRRILLVSDGVEYTSEQQFAPLVRHALPIAHRFGIVFHFVKPDVARAMSPKVLRSFAAVGLKLSFRTPAAEAEILAKALFEPLKGHPTRAIVFDGDDDLGVLWPTVIAQCDAYIKKHMHVDRASYAVNTVGKTNLTDEAHRVHGVDFTNDIVPTSGGLAPDLAKKIVLGWNIALDDKIYDLNCDLNFPTDKLRRYDLTCRASVPDTIWTHGHRSAAVEAILALQDKYRVHAPTDRVPQEEYYKEMLDSRVVISPFGFGELCWRDFEAIICGAVLVKPDTSHLQTKPDLFVTGETYIPVSWDFSDLELVCAPYLADESRRRKLAVNAKTRLLESLSADWFLNRFADVLDETGINAV